MLTKTKHKIQLFFGLAIAAVVCCTLPFLANKQISIVVYPSNQRANITEQSFIAALKGEGYAVKIAPEKTSITDIAIWFRTPKEIDNIAKSSAKYNFLYTKEHYPFDWYKIPNPPIVLTPHNDLYEHYIRSNLKAALIPELNKTTAPIIVTKIKEIINWLNQDSEH